MALTRYLYRKGERVLVEQDSKSEKDLRGIGFIAEAPKTPRPKETKIKRTSKAVTK